MIEKRLFIGLIVGCGLFFCSCHSVYMSAEDRLQENYEEVDASVELETVDEISVFSYSDVPIIPYTIENLAKGFTRLDKSEIEHFKMCDQYNQKSLVVPEKGIDLQINYGDVGFYFYAISHEDAQKYLNVTQPAYHERAFTFAELANRFPKKNLETLSREEAIEICNRAISDAKISAVFENVFALDCETLNQLQEDAKSQYKEDFYMAPGSEYLLNEDGTGRWNVKKWKKEQEAYYLVYRMQLEGRTLDTTGYPCKIELFCREDGQIIYANGNCPELNLVDAKGEEQKIVSVKDAYSIAANLLKKKKLDQSQICSVKYSYGYQQITALDGEAENIRTIVTPCWEICYDTDVQGTRIKDYLYLNAVTGLEAIADVY